LQAVFFILPRGGELLPPRHDAPLPPALTGKQDIQPLQREKRKLEKRTTTGKKGYSSCREQFTRKTRYPERGKTALDLYRHVKEINLPGIK